MKLEILSLVSGGLHSWILIKFLGTIFNFLRSDCEGKIDSKPPWESFSYECLPRKVLQSEKPKNWVTDPTTQEVVLRIFSSKNKNARRNSTHGDLSIAVPKSSSKRKVFEILILRFKGTKLRNFAPCDPLSVHKWSKSLAINIFRTICGSNKGKRETKKNRFSEKS